MPESLDIVIPTFNRSVLLAECLESVLRAKKPAALEWQVTVVNNNSTDDTERVIRAFESASNGRVHYVFEKRQGRSAAINAGIAQSAGSIIGLIDDDEQIGDSWMQVIEERFRDATLDFIGGPCLALWRAPRPDWLPPGYEGVLSADDPKDLPTVPVPFGGSEAFLRGGNSVLRRSVFARVGFYTVELGRQGEGALASCEDADFFSRLLAAGAKGLFVPELIIHHVVPPERVTRAYHRKWAWGHATSLAHLDRLHPQKVPYVGRVPRYLIGQPLRRLPDLLRFGSPAQRFSAELQWWTLAGFLCGAYFKGE